MFVLHRHGCLALTTALFFYYALLRTPLTMQLDQWYIARSTSLLLALAVIGAWAFRVSLAGRPLFGAVLADEEAPA